MNNKAIVKSQNRGLALVLQNQNGYREIKSNIRCPELPDDFWEL